MFMIKAELNPKNSLIGLMSLFGTLFRTLVGTLFGTRQYQKNKKQRSTHFLTASTYIEKKCFGDK